MVARNSLTQRHERIDWPRHALKPNEPQQPLGPIARLSPDPKGRSPPPTQRRRAAGLDDAEECAVAQQDGLNSAIDRVDERQRRVGLGVSPLREERASALGASRLDAKPEGG
jgi:hypothetical protein